MNFRFLSTMIFTCVAFFFPACTPKPVIDENAAFSTIKDNVNAIQNKDLEGAMATIHPESPNYSATRQDLQKLFKKYDLRISVSDLKVVSATPNEVQVHFVQKTEKLKGPDDLKSFTSDGVHTLRKDNGKWKIYNTIPGNAVAFH